MFAFPGGALLDRLGPRSTACLATLATAAGLLLFGVFEIYYAGFVVMAVAGPLVFMATISLANYFPPVSGSITGACVGAFDASSIVFPALSALMSLGSVCGFNQVF